jgi:OmpA-OmpF porin, OOP family
LPALDQVPAPLSTTTLALLAFVLAAGVMVSVAYGSALVIESRTQQVVTARLAERQVDWISVGRTACRCI